MIKRPFWLLTGVAVGVSGTLWAERRLREMAERLEPDHLARELAERARGLGERVLDAVETGRTASERRERELRRELRLGPHLTQVAWDPSRVGAGRRRPSRAPGRPQTRR